MLPKVPQKLPKWSPKAALRILTSPLSRKSGTLRKHQYLPCFKHIPASDSSVISTPKSIKNLPWNPYCYFATPNHEKVTKMTTKWVQGRCQSLPKIDKNAGLVPQVSFGVSLGTPGSPKWFPRVEKWSLQASQKATWGIKITLSSRLPVINNHN